MKCSEGLSSRVSHFIRRYKCHIKFAVYMVFSFITFFRVFLVPFFIIFYSCVYGCMVCLLLFIFVNFVFLLCLFYYYVYVFLFLRMFCIFGFVLFYVTFCVNEYCVTATGCQPNCS